jgi:hypothetical protein
MNEWNPWKVTTLGLVLVVATALITGVVVARWSGGDRSAVTSEPTTSAPAASVATQAAPATSVAPPPHAVAEAGPPSQSAIEACNRRAAEQSGARDKAWDTAKDAGIGAVGGAAVGALGGAIAGGGKGAGKGAAIGGLVGAGGGTLYGLNENKKHDERYRAAYAACMHSRGYRS